MRQSASLSVTNELDLPVQLVKHKSFRSERIELPEHNV